MEDDDAAVFISSEDVMEEYDADDAVGHDEGEEDEEMDDDDEVMEDEERGEVAGGDRTAGAGAGAEAAEEMASSVDMSHATFAGHSDSVYCIAANPKDPTQFITGGGDDKAYLWRIGVVESQLPADDVGEGTTKPLSPAVTSQQESCSSTRVNVPIPVSNSPPFEAENEQRVMKSTSEDRNTRAATSTSTSISTTSTALKIGNNDNKNIVNAIELVGHSDTVSCVGFSTDGTLAASGAYDGTVLVWQSDTGKRQAILEGPEDVEWLCWHSKGNVIMAGSADATVWMWMASTGVCMQVFAGHQKKVSCGLFTPSGRAVVTGSEDGTIKVWAPKKGECRLTIGGHGFHEGPVTCMVAHPAGDENPLVLSGSEDGSACLSHLVTGKVLLKLQHSEIKAATPARNNSEEQEEEEEVFSVEGVGFSLTHPWVATCGIDGCLKIWEMQTGVCRQSCLHSAGVTALAWHPALPHVFTTCADGVLRCWDGLTGAVLQEFTGHTDMVIDMQMIDLESEVQQALRPPPPPALEGGAAAAMGEVVGVKALRTKGRVLLASSSDDATARIYIT